MTYKYKKDDIFYDVESLSNVFTVAWWHPCTTINAVVLSYLDDDNIIKSHEDLEYIKNYIYKLHPSLKKNKTQIIFEDISKTGKINEFVKNGAPELGMQSFAKRLGLVNKTTQLNARIDQREIESDGIKYHKAYYPVKQTDPDYDENLHGYRFGYNSTNYDVTILAELLGNLHDKYFTEDYTNRQVCKDGSVPLTAKSLREFNDELFSDDWRGRMPMRLAHSPNLPPHSFGDFNRPAWILRKGWLNTGRYIDVSKLNERVQKVGLKRLLGMLGLQIMESDKLSNNTRVNTLEEFADLLAYNISDVINLQTLFEHYVYQNGFNVRGYLLETYPQTIYDQKKGFKQPNGQELQADVGNYTNIRRDRLARDSTSAKFVEFALAPYKPIKDIPQVSFMYPSEIEAKKLGIQRTDILEDTKKFFEETVTSDPNDQAHKDFMEVYNFYDKIRGFNFNQSKAYKEHYGEHYNDYYGDGFRLPEELIPKDNKYIRQLMKDHNTNLFYHQKNENGEVYRSTCLANFSIGGIHGAEVYMDKYLADEEEYQIELTMQKYVEGLYESALEAINGDIYIELPKYLKIPKRIEKKIREDHTIKIREFIKGGSTKKKAAWREVTEVPLFRKNTTGNWQVNPKYTYVSVGPCNHEDFTSYYPLLLSRLSAFINPSYHGYEDDGVTPKDPYYGMFLDRVATRAIARDKSQPDNVRRDADEEQESKKLLINAATGAGDATFDNNIRVNNAIISMRIIGQLFAWRIGQAQTMAGAKVPSTNTDGLYTMNISAELNDKILEEISGPMHIEIEPERLDRFVSKDSNNRLEYYKNKITSAKGGTLNSWGGPAPTQSLDHAAIIDRVLAQYLACDEMENPANVEFDREKAQKMFIDFIKEHIKAKTPQEALKFFQWILASSTGTHRYNYAKHININTGEYTIENLQSYNRIFLIKEQGNTRTEIHLATRRVVNKAKWDKQLKEYKNGTRQLSDLWEHDPEALEILKQNGLDLMHENKNERSKYYKDEASRQKVRGMPNEQHVGIYNDSILDLPDEKALQMINMLDIDAYLEILENTFQSWSNL